jgi:outer membrane protein OmpA-like peptidoglycan-associated protein
MRNIFLCLALSAFASHSQNLVFNPGFEYYRCSGWSISSIELCTDWSAPSEQTPDYFNNACAQFKTSVIPDLHWWGPQLPRTGNSYMGIIAIRPNNGPEDALCEYIQGTLRKPLEEGVKYTISVNVSLAECSMLSLKYLDVYFSEKKIKDKNLRPLKYNPQVRLSSEGADTVNWVTLSQTFTARGNETHFIIGCFDNGKKVKYSKVRPSKAIKGPRDEAYYFIDDVSVVEEGTEDFEPKPELPVVVKTKVDTSKPKPVVIDVPIVLKNIFFETGKFELLPQSFAELDKLANTLKENPETFIKINGYTDNVGKKQDNITLSLNRAKAVFDYLVQKGIDAARLSHEGFGDKNPISTNDTESGREQNRRVEFILSKKK